jgi:transcriptional regulator with XRE-family HTH domain
MSLAVKLRELRKKRKLSQAALAKEADISKAYLWQLENEEDKQPSAEILYRLATTLGVTIADLLDKPVRIASLDSVDIPDSLKQLMGKRGEELDIQEDDLKMLLSIKYRGRQPKTQEEWEFILRSIKMTLGERDD